jgi:hypothetical protein
MRNDSGHEVPDIHERTNQKIRFACQYITFISSHASASTNQQEPLVVKRLKTSFIRCLFLTIMQDVRRHAVA